MESSLNSSELDDLEHLSATDVGSNFFLVFESSRNWSFLSSFRIICLCLWWYWLLYPCESNSLMTSFSCVGVFRIMMGTVALCVWRTGRPSSTSTTICYTAWRRLRWERSSGSKGHEIALGIECHLCNDRENADLATLKNPRWSLFLKICHLCQLCGNYCTFLVSTF